MLPVTHTYVYALLEYVRKSGASGRVYDTPVGTKEFFRSERLILTQGCMACWATGWDNQMERNFQASKI